jgi:putative transposase
LVSPNNQATTKRYATISKSNVIEIRIAQDLLAQYAQSRSEAGTAGVVRNGYLPERELQTSLGPIPVKIPKVRSKTGEPVTFRSALEEVLAETRQQRCWMHKTMNVVNCLPKLSQPKAKQALHNSWQAETLADGEKAFDLFVATYDAKYPKATLCLQQDREELMAFYNFLAQVITGVKFKEGIEVKAID